MRTKVDYRQIYIDNYGEIPRGYDIHHKDGNCHNNEPDNLEALHPIEHAKRHRDMGENAAAALIMSRYDRHHRTAWKLYQKAFGVRTGRWANRNYYIETPLIETVGRAKRKDILTLEKNNWEKPDNWGYKRYRSTIYLDYSKDFDDPDHSFVNDAIHLLSERQADVIKRNFGFLGPKQSIDEIAEDLNIGRATVQRDRAKALEIIKKEISFKFS